MAPPLEFERKGWSMKSWVQNPLDAFKPKMNKIIISYPYWLNKTISKYYAPHITYKNNKKQTLISKFWGRLWILKAHPRVFFFVILFKIILSVTSLNDISIFTTTINVIFLPPCFFIPFLESNHSYLLVHMHHILHMKK